MSGFSVHGRTHRLLARLAEGDCGFAALYDAVHAGVWTEPRRKKLHRLLQVLQSEALVGKDDGRIYFILEAGERELDRLDRAAGEKGYARVFGRAA